MVTLDIQAVCQQDGNSSLKSVCCAQIISNVSAGHPAGDGLKPKAKVPTQPISQPEAKGHRKYKRKLPIAVGDFQTPQLDDGLVRKTEKKKPDDKAGDRVMQPPQSSAKAQSGPASNALSHPTSVEKGKKKKKEERSSSATSKHCCDRV